MRKLQRGAAIQETGGSIEDFLRSLRVAFYRLNPDTPAEYLYVRDVFADHIIIESNLLPSNQFYRVPYSISDGVGGLLFQFESRPQWEIVELDYVPAARQEVPNMPAVQGAAGAPPAAAEPEPDQASAQPVAQQPVAEGKRITRQPAAFRMQLRNDTPAPRPLQGSISEAAGSKAGNKRLSIGEAIRADDRNLNNRIYPLPVLRAAVAEVQPKLTESVGQGRALLMTPEGAPIVGEADHPSSKGKNPELLGTVVAWDAMQLNEETGAVSISGLIADTSLGRDILALAEIGVLPGGSLRGYGVSQFVATAEGGEVEEVLELHITGYDLVLTPAFPNAHTTHIESVAPKNSHEGDNDMGLEAFLKALKENAELAAQVRAALGVTDVSQITQAQADAWQTMVRTQLKLAEGEDVIAAIKAGQDARRQLAEAQAQADIAAAVAAATRELPFGELNESFLDAVRSQKFTAADQVAPFVEGKRKEYAAIAAKVELQNRGMDTTKRPAAGAQVGGSRRVTVLGPVIENAGLAPEYATAAHSIGEKLLQARPSEFMRWKESAPSNVNQDFAVKVLAEFDRVHKRALMAENAQFAEALTASDLNLPVSITRAIIARAVPRLVAPSIFTTGVMTGPTDQWWYRTYAEETGATKTVTDELIAVPASLAGGVTLSLGNQRIKPGTVVLQNNAANVTYTENTDFFIDYGNGKITFPSTSTVPTAASAKIDYQYLAIRKGEDQAIERAKIGLTSKTMTAKADRLATKITREALVFGRAAMGMDVAVETLADLAFEISRKIDGDLMRTALYAVRTGLNAAATGTFDLSDALADVTKTQLLVNYIGQARQKIVNRYYSADWILMSGTLADYAANWPGFTQAGSRPDADLDAQGYAGRLKSMPVFWSTEFPDDVVLVGGRELAGYFVQRPMELFGPHPTYKDVSGELMVVAADQYYIEEFNATDAPIGEKGALVAVQA